MTTDAAAPVRVAADGDVLAALLAAPGPVVTAIVAGPFDAPGEALVRAAVTLAATRRAPAARVNAVLARPGAATAAIDGAVAFLARAEATTGQTIAPD